MSTNRPLTLLTLCALALGAACSFGALPEWTRSANPSVSISLAAIDPDGTGSTARAVAQGGGYLYLRTLGGPSGTSGSFYGPYEISSGGTVTVNDIPAGNFSRFFAVYSGNAVNTTTKYSILGGSYTFGEFMSVSDDLMGQFLDNIGGKKGSGDGEDMANAFGGTGSYGVTGSVTLVAGATNSLSLALIPITSSSTSIHLSQSPSFAFKSDSATKCFYRLDGISVSSPVTAGSLICTMYADSATSGSLDSVAFYDGKGKAVAATKTGSSLTGGYSWAIDASAVNALVSSTGYVDLYLYIAYSGAINARFVNTVPPNVYVAIDGEANSAWRGRKVLFGVYDESAVANIRAGKSLQKQVPVAMGTFTLDSTTGDGAVTVQSPAIKAGSTYYVSAHVDENGTYAALSDFTGVDLATLIPYKGDIITSGDADLISGGVYGLNAFTAGSAATLTASGFSTYSDNVYFASSTGSGSGSSPSSPTTFALAMSSAAANAPAQIYVLDDISSLSSQIVSTQMTIQSYGGTARTIAAASTLSSMALFQVNSSGRLEFNNITIDCSSVSYQSMSFLNVANLGYLALGSDATLIGKPTSTYSQGGGINVAYNGTLEMWGSTVKNCCSSSKGGGIYIDGSVGYSTMVTIGPGCLFTNNTSSQGAVIYAARYSTVYIKSTAFTLNTSNMAGNAVIDAEGDVYAKDLSFTSNTADHDYVSGLYGSWGILP